MRMGGSPLLLVGAMVLLAALDFLGAVLAKEWAAERNHWLFAGGLVAFGVLFAVYAVSLKLAELSTVTWSCPPRPARTWARAADGGAAGTSSTARRWMARASAWSVVSQTKRARRSWSTPASTGSVPGSVPAMASRARVAAASGSPP